MGEINDSFVLSKCHQLPLFSGNTLNISTFALLAESTYLRIIL